MTLMSVSMGADKRNEQGRNNQVSQWAIHIGLAKAGFVKRCQAKDSVMWEICQVAHQLARR